ncbi:P-loop containing nucleoside triphosphate hydrolase protein [Melampsora americana]|nr:P-loop containing nucleoside triphosphate hydrolase protein [Melampsora americana]
MNPNANSFQGFRTNANTFQPGAIPPGSSNPPPTEPQPQSQSQPQHGGYQQGTGYGTPYQSQGAPHHHPYQPHYQHPHHQPQGYGQHQAYNPYPAGYPTQTPFHPSQHSYGYPQQHYQRPQHQQQAPDHWEDPVARSTPPVAPRVNPASQSAPGANTNGGKTISLASTTRSKPSAPGAGSVDKPAVMSLSIGGSKKKESVPVKTNVELKNGASSSRTQTPVPSNKKVLSNTNSPGSSHVKTTVQSDSGTSTPPTQATETGRSRETTTDSSTTSEGTGKVITMGEVKRHVKDADAIKSEVEAAVDEETLRDLYESKKENEIKEEGKTHVNIVFIGHVDAGKSTMGGNILYLTGMVDKRTMEKLEKEAKEAGRESWYLSWALDSTIQERSQGKTVEIGRAYFETEKRRYTILDAPGHKTYVPAMISGASQADIAILVISARKGEFETGFERGGQTREHAMLVKTTGVSKLIVVINKMDDITVEWDQARFDEILNKLTPFLKGTGFNPSKDITFIPVSGYTGANIKEKVSKEKCAWYEGPPLLDLLDNMQLLDRKYNAPLMMPVSEKYKDMGTVVVGKLESGRVVKGASVLMMPNKTSVEVSAIYNEMEDEVPRALCGDNVRIRLKGIEDEDVSPGFVLTDSVKPIHTVTRFEAQLAILDSKNIICAGYGAVMHVHTLAEECTLSSLLHYYDKKSGKKSRRPPQFAKKGMKVVALLEMAAPICVETFKDYPQLGRFTLRDEGKTIAIGKITKLLIEHQDELNGGMKQLNLMGGTNVNNSNNHHSNSSTT